LALFSSYRGKIRRAAGPLLPKDTLHGLLLLQVRGVARGQPVLNKNKNYTWDTYRIGYSVGWVDVGTTVFYEKIKKIEEVF
jgi:hypothetical protein